MFIRKNLFLVLSVVFISTLLFLKANIIKKDFSAEKINELKEKDDSPQERIQTTKERNEYFFMLLRDPSTNSIPENIREKELSFAEHLPKSENRLLKGSSTLAVDWKEAGPIDVGGRTRAIAVDVANNNNVIAGGVSGGIWKTTNKGTTWSFKSSKSSILSVTSVAQDTRPGYQNNWYAIGGEFDGNSARSRGGGANFYGGGFYKSTDNGETWNLVATNLSSPNGTTWNSIFSYAQRIVVSPTTGSIFVASHWGIIIKSTNGGTTWTTIKGGQNDHYYTDIIVNQTGVLVAVLSQLAYNTSPTDNPGIFESTNDGSSWTDITPSTFPNNYSRTVMAFAPSNPNLIYTLANTGLKQKADTKKDSVNLFKINISSLASTDLTNKLPDFSPSSGSYIDTQIDYNLAIAVCPTNENIVFIAGTSLFRSFDGFATKPADLKTNWIGGYNPTTFFYQHLHPDIHTIVFDNQSSNGIWVGHDGGISYASDATTTNYTTYFPWADQDSKYNVTQYYTMAISPTSGDKRIFGGAQDNGSPFFKWDGVNATSSTDITTGDGSYSYLGTAYSYGGTQNGDVSRYGYKTDNSGDIDRSNWTTVTPSGATGMKFINPYTVDPNNEEYMYYLAGNMLWRNNSLSSIPNFGNNPTSQGWSSIDLQLPQGYTYSTLVVSKSNPVNVLYLAASSTTGTPKIYKMSNSTTSTSATDITSNLGAAAGSYVHSIAVNPDNADELLVVISNYNVKSLWYTINGGITWSDVEGNFTSASVRSATILPLTLTTRMFFIGTSIGVYSTNQMNGTSTVWTQEGANVMGNVVVEYVTSRKSDATIIAATHGRGAFVGKYTPTDVNNENTLPTAFELKQNYPNPFNPTTVISFQLSASSDVKLKIYDALGREIETLVNSKMDSGKHEITFNASRLASGIYIYELTAGSFRDSKKMLLMK